MAHDQRIRGRLSGLNPKQTDAVSHLDGALLVVAGPGSGKTRVLTHRIAALVDIGAGTHEILAVTFTNKAAGEMRDRLAVLLPELDDAQLARMWVSTFHAACARMLRYEGAAIGIDPRFTIADSNVAKRVLKSVLDDTGIAVDDDLVNNAAATISRAKNDLVDPDGMRASANATTRSWADTAAAYQAALAEQNLLDFDDLLVRAVDLMKVPEARERWTRRFRYVLVDEFQDTNAAQYELLRLLCAGHQQLCVVGDAQQSIYGWRGAQPELLTQLHRDFPDITVVTLDQNYRSTKQIVAASKALIAPLTADAVAAADLWTDNDDGDPVEVVTCADDRDEARWVIDQVMRDGNYDEHAVLLRTNAQTNLLEQELAGRGMPYRLVGAMRFYDRAEIRDALAWLQLAVSPTNREAFRRACAAPKRGIGDKSLDLILDGATGALTDPVTWLRNALVAGELPGRLSTPAEGLLEALQMLTDAAQHGPAKAVRVLLDDVGLIEHFRNSKDLRSEERVENLEELYAAASRFEPTPGTDPDAALVAFLEHVALASSADDDGDGGVWLITAHAAKGREFPNVWVVGCEDGYFPHSRSVSSDARAEERRLLFVAASRAERRLTFTWALRRFLFGNVADRARSTFLNDLPVDVVQRVTPAVRSDEDTSSASGAWRSKPRRTTPSRGTFSTSRLDTPRTPAAPKPAAASETFTAGDRVVHPRFGAGEVTTVDGDRIVIRFDDATTKTLSLAYAPLVRDL